MSIADEKYLALTTFRKDGGRKSTAIWIAALSSDVEGDVGFTTGADSWKLKRLRNDPRCELQPCSSRGEVTEGSLVLTGRAREATAEELATVEAAIDAKYGFQVKLIKASQKAMKLVGRNHAGATTGIVITLD
ncbi:MAG: PPOX class F420-dependent oxidoreductase [Acidimicrobiales bacterium]